MKKFAHKFSIKYYVLRITYLIQPKSNLQPTTYNLQPTRGFTLVELLIYMGLLMVLIVVFTEIFSSIIENQLSSQNTSSIAEDGRYIYSRFIYDVNRAQSITEPASLGSSSSSLILVINSQNHTYGMNGNNLALTTPSGQNQLNGYGTSISDLQFTRVGSTSGKHTVRLNFKISGNISQRAVIESKIFQTTAGLR